MSLVKTAGIIAGTATVTIALSTLIFNLTAPKQQQAFTLAPLAQSTPIATPATIAPVTPKPTQTPAPKVVIKEVVKVVYVPAPEPATIAPLAPKPTAPPAPSNVCDRQCEADFMAEGIAEAKAIVDEKALYKGLEGQAGIVMSHDGDGFVNLRAAPKGNVLRKMLNDTPVTIVRGLKVDGKDWLLVSVGNTRGWMIGAGFEFK